MGKGGWECAAEMGGGQGAHEDARALRPRADGIHAEAVAQERATALAA